MRHALAKQTRAQLAAGFKHWLTSCRDNALDWPVDSLARSYGMKAEDVSREVLAEKRRRSVNVA